MAKWQYITASRRIGSGWFVSDLEPEEPRKKGLPEGHDLTLLLNRLGNDGWELVTAVADQLILKRPIAGAIDAMADGSA